MWVCWANAFLLRRHINIQHVAVEQRRRNETHGGLVLPAVAGVFALVVSCRGASVPLAAGIRPLRLSFAILGGKQTKREKQTQVRKPDDRQCFFLNMILTAPTKTKTPSRLKTIVNETYNIQWLYTLKKNYNKTETITRVVFKFTFASKSSSDISVQHRNILELCQLF